MSSGLKGLSIPPTTALRIAFTEALQGILARLAYFFTEWVLSTNHRRIAVLYFFFVLLSGFTGLVLATIIRLELAYPGKFFLTNNAERYLTTISLHGVVMVFFMIIPVLFGAFGNFLLPTQLGIRDVAFPRLNSFMFWVTPSGFVLLLHILLFDRSYNLTYWVNYGEIKSALRRRYQTAASLDDAVLFPTLPSDLTWRLAGLREEAPLALARGLSSPANLGAPTRLAGAPRPLQGGLGASQPTAAWVSVPMAGEAGSLSPLPGTRTRLPATDVLGGAGSQDPLQGYTWGGLGTTTLSSGAGNTGATQPFPTPRGQGASAGGRTPQTNIEASADWRGLKLEREMWRSSDFLGQGLQTFWYRRRYYTNLLSPSSLVNKVSI